MISHEVLAPFALSPMKFLLLNQTFYPDVMATGQYLTDVALALVERGHQVTVIAGRRAYDAPHRTFAGEEVWRGIRIIRVGSTWFGKQAKWKRAANFLSFMALCAARLISLPKQDVVVALTSPPMIALLGVWLATWHRGRFIYWIMDFNPDEAIAAHWLKEGSLMARLLERASRLCLQRAHKILTLDRFMYHRILTKGAFGSKTVVLPLWSQGIAYDAAGRDRFRNIHGIQDKFVVMYSGNHSPCHPLDSLLEAAKRLEADLELVFCFIGGGSEFAKLQRRPKRPNAIFLPYQPWEQLADSLSAADLHVVVMGDGFVGLVHPCKIYNLLPLGTPILYIGPDPSPVTQLLGFATLAPGLNEAEPVTGYTFRPSLSVETVPRETAAGLLHFQARHGEVKTILDHIRYSRKNWTRNRSPEVSGTCMEFSRQALLPKLIAALEAR